MRFFGYAEQNWFLLAILVITIASVAVEAAPRANPFLFGLGGGNNRDNGNRGGGRIRGPGRYTSRESREGFFETIADFFF